jgi:phthiocerol/phenolphthiocerol synthesis type-I polyketide synthase C
MQAGQMRHDPTQVFAVVGMAGRFPAAPDLDSFWRLMIEGRDAIRPIPPSRWDSTAQLDPEKKIQSVGGFIEDVDKFDATFFGISPREAENIDPQQRLMLEASWLALEDAGVTARSLNRSRTGVYVGAGWHDYESVGKDRGASVTQHTAPGIALDMIAARVSYFLQLTGPSLVVETGCSSSLVAVHLACQALRAGEIDAAIVGGVHLMLHPFASVALTHFGGLSPDGLCRTYGAGANGFVRGEGVGAIFIKTLARALRDGDRIHAVIVGTAVNNDGGGQSVVAPNPAGQEDLLRLAYARFGVSADDLAYIEGHGTGTAVGDPIEAGAIGRVLGQSRTRGPLPIGSVKTNIGHLEAGAGMPGLIKAILSVKNRVVPPSLNAEELNPEIPFDELNLQVVREALHLPESGDVYIGVSAFGWGGTNAHVLVMNAPEGVGRDAVVSADRADEETAKPLLLPLSAHSQQALQQRARDIRETLAAGRASLAAIAGTLAWQRDQFPVRAAFIVNESAQAQTLLEHYIEHPDDEIPGVVKGRAATVGRVAFVFPGQGSQWAGMGRDLLATNLVFAETIHRCAKALEPHVDWDLVKVVSGEAGDGWLSRLDMLQPTLWAVSLGLCEMWRAAGVEPDVVVGHSQGEVTAATAAGILSYEDGAMVVARRSAIAQRTSGKGRMLAVDLDVESAKAALAGFEEGVSLAVNNGPNSCVLSGDTELILALKEILEAEGTFCRLVNVDYASHSPQMDALKDDLLEALRDVRPGIGKIQLMSSVRVAPLQGPEMDARYWVDNLREPVLFANAMDRIFDDGVTHVIEISPHPVLTPAIEQLAALRPVPPQVLSTLRRDQGSMEKFRESLAQAYVTGLEPFNDLPQDAWAPVPAYPWQRSSYWVASGRRRSSRSTGLDVALTPVVGEMGAWSATLELAADDIPWVRDHQVHDAVVLPGVGMMEFALRTALARSGAAHRTLADVEFRNDLTFTDAPVTLSLQWRDNLTEGGTFTLHSLPEGATTWTLHASARVLLNSTATETPVFPEHLLRESPIEPEEFYSKCSARGLNYGPAFQGVQRLYAGDGETLAEVKLSDKCVPTGYPHRLHPALWDGVLQTCIPLFEGSDAAVPVSVRRVHLLQDLAEPVTSLWSHAIRRGEKACDLYVFDSENQPLMIIEGLRMQTLAPESAPTAALSDRVHRLVFEHKPRTGTAVPAGTWMICAAASEAQAAEELAAALRAQGATATITVSGEEAVDTAVWDQRLGTDELAGVAFLAPRAEAGLTAQREGLLTLTALTRACVSRPQVPRMVVITADAQVPAGTTGTCDPGAALYWGFGRVLRCEHPEVRSVLIDTSSADPAWSTSCAAELLSTDSPDQVVLRGEDRLVGRMLRGEAGEDDESRVEHKPAWRTVAQPFRLSTDRPGFWENLAYRPLARRAPGPDEVEIETTAASLNFIDVMKVLGNYPDPSADPKLGVDAVGVVTRVGANVTKFAPGDRVVTCTLGGALGSHQTVPAEIVHPVPEWMDDANAVALPAVMTTAWLALNDLARLRSGETVLIHSAAGGLGLAAIQVAKLLGAKVIATAGSEAKRNYLAELGIEHVFNSRDLSWADDVRAATEGRGVDVVLNSLTGAAIPLGLDLLADGGRFIEVGKVDIYGGRSISLDAFKKGISVASVDLAGMQMRRPKAFAQLLAEVWKLITERKLGPLPLLRYTFAEAPAALREMSHGAHIGKFVVLDPTTVTSIAPEPMLDGRFRADGAYLITGGLGALGLSLAEFMADRGAGTLALVGRSAPGEQAVARIEKLRARGVRVETFQADVADPAAVEQVLAQLPPLRGVVHAAGLLDDATILNVKPEQLRRVLAPKVDGARNLDAATAGHPLDFFLLFSSAAGLFGNAGQAAYAAANAYMDALAVARRQRGLPALSVQWGPFTEVGLAAADDMRGARLAERGMTGFTTDEAWQALEQFLSRDQQVVSYAPLNLRQYFDSYPEHAALESFSALREIAESGGTGTSAGAAFLAELHAASESQRLEMLEAKVRELASRVLRLDAKAIDRDTPFKALGLDSLMGLELRNRLEATFGLRLSPTLLWTYGTSRALAGVLAERLFGDAASASDKD